MNTRCQYCGKEIAEGEDFCSESCASAYRTATGTKLSDLKWLLIGIAVSLFVILWGPITRNEQMVASVWAPPWICRCEMAAGDAGNCA